MSLKATSIKNAPKLQEQLGKTNIFQVPKLDKVIVAMWVWSLATRKWVKDFTDLEENLRVITGQQPQMILSRKAVSNFKLREGMPAMLRCTLRAELIPEDIKTPMGVQITLATTSDNDPDAKAFLESLWIIFSKK